MTVITRAGGALIAPSSNLAGGPQLISASQPDKVSAPKLQAASSDLTRVVAATGRESYQTEAASIEKRTRTLMASCAKKDVGAAAVTSTKLAVELTDLAYEWAATEKPLAEITGGAPPTKPKDGYVSDEQISKTMKRQL